ncbi:MAG TPA: SRPBCC domain-containing protein [Allosphingosinicella sp.]|uniref:SRPBCC family protein n=1 Tax=Allosphingosinicella sp. TaxID=2823234 RepID=UPI002EDA4FD2
MIKGASEIIDKVEVRRIFPAPLHRVFRAWTDPQDFILWWRPGEWRTTSVDMETHVGGAYRIIMERPDGAIQTISGTYVEFDAPVRLAMTWSVAGAEAGEPFEAFLLLDFVAVQGGTEIWLRHEKLPHDRLGNYEAGWTHILNSLSGMFERLKNDSK